MGSTHFNFQKLETSPHESDCFNCEENMFGKDLGLASFEVENVYDSNQLNFNPLALPCHGSCYTEFSDFEDISRDLALLFQNTTSVPSLYEDIVVDAKPLKAIVGSIGQCYDHHDNGGPSEPVSMIKTEYGVGPVGSIGQYYDITNGGSTVTMIKREYGVGSIGQDFNGNQYDSATNLGLGLPSCEVESVYDFSYLNFNSLATLPCQSSTCYPGFSDFASLYEDRVVDAKPALKTIVGSVGQYYDTHGATNVGSSSEVPAVTVSVMKRMYGVCATNGGEEWRSSGRKRTAPLELDEIQKYFDVPITKAAKMMKVGVTVLKKRCRELNIMRWPHRKIKSLKYLIHNVKEMGLTNEIVMLEEHKRLLQEVPDMELSHRTKRLRQACFKANYKKRRSFAALY